MLGNVARVGFVFLAFAGDAPAVKIIHFRIGVIFHPIRRGAISALWTQDSQHAPATVHKVAVVLHNRDVIVQENHGVDIIRIGFLWLSGQIPQPLRNIGGGGGRTEAQQSNS